MRCVAFQLYFTYEIRTFASSTIPPLSNYFITQMRKLLPLMLMLTIGLCASAKLKQFIVRGYIEQQDYSRSEWDRPAVDSVYVDLMYNDTIPVEFKLLVGNDDLKLATNGNLRMMVNGDVGKYSLILTRDGYEPLRHEFKLSSEGQDVVYLRSIFMEKRRENTLNEVEVVGTAIKMVMKGDTLVYDSRAFKLAEGSSLDALIRQLPGAQLADDGSITVNGKKVNSLLINGNDFFQGDPDVALKNLPAYTVDKIKVYDKSGKDDNVTLASHKLNDSPENENMVMDVTLKKEFSMATVLSVEGGYGPGIYSDKDPKKFDHRYIGRAFIIGFGKNYRWSAYGNTNNIRNTSKANSSDRNWGYGWSPDGELKVALGGFDVFYNPTKKWELSANMLYTDENIDKHSLSAITTFYSGINLYRRSRNDSNEHRNHLESGTTLRYIGDNTSLTVNASVDWLRYDVTSRTYTANFNRNPRELSRGAAIDSLFAPGAGLRPSDNLLKSVITGDYQSSYGKGLNSPDRLRLSASLNASYRPTKARGVFSVSGHITDTHNTSLYGNIYDQPYVADPDVTPLRQQKWTDNDHRSSNASASMIYAWDKSFISTTRIRNINFSPSVSWNMYREKRDNELLYQTWLQSIDPKDNPLPSMTAPENIKPLIDANNTFNSLYLTNDIGAAANLGFKSDVTVPSDSGLNATYYANIRYNYTTSMQHLSYHEPYQATPFNYHNDKTDGLQMFDARLGFWSSNKIRYFSINTYYSMSTSSVSLKLLSPAINSSDPLHIYMGPEDGVNLRNPLHHQVYLSSYYYHQKRHNSMSLWASYSQTRNATSTAAVYNPDTGVTIHRPMSVNGNWSADANLNYDMPFGPHECWAISISGSYNHSNDVDYMSAIGQPLRSVVRSNSTGGNLKLTYKLTNGTSFGIKGGTTWQKSTSPRKDFRTITAWTSNIGASINFYLPWQIEGETTLRANFRRGYEDSALNTTEWIWNAWIQKSILKGNMTFKLQAVDILGQLSAISSRVDAHGRSETWTNSLPRYVMLTVSYRFNFMPKAMKTPE